MGIFTRLDVVNDMLGILGEANVNSLDAAHPLVAKALTYLKTGNARIQGSGWWFNTERITLTPTLDGTILLPAATLQLDPTDPDSVYVARGGQLYNPAPGNGSPTQFSYPVEVMLVRLLDYEDLPVQAQLTVGLSSQLQFGRDLDGDTSKLNEIRQDLLTAMIYLNAEHIRAQDSNLLRNPSFQATFGGLRGPLTGRRLSHR